MVQSFVRSSIARQLLASAAAGLLILAAFVWIRGNAVLPKDRDGQNGAAGDREHLSSTVPEENPDLRFKSSRPRVHTEPSRVEKRLRATILPRIDFENVTVGEAVDFLRLRTSEITRGMAKNADEEMAGLPSDKTRSPLEGLDDRLVNQRITLQRTDISAWDAMSLVAREIGMKVTVVDGSLVLIK